MRFLSSEEFPAKLLVAALGRPGLGRFPLRRDHGVPAAERVSDRGQQVSAERRQRLGQRKRERLLVRPLGKLRLPELDKQETGRLARST